MSTRRNIGIEVVLAVAVATCALWSAGASAEEGRATVSRTQTGSTQVARSSTREVDTAAAWHSRRGQWFQRNWGVDIVGVKRVSSGYMLRFDYRVTDPALAAVLSDRHAKPYLIDETSRTALAVPAMENIGELRQVTTLQQNRTYFIIFGNPGRLVKPGGRVTLVVGNFRAEGLVVE